MADNSTPAPTIDAAAMASFMAGIKARATAIINGRYNFTPDGQKTPLTGLKVTYAGGSANIPCDAVELAKYGDGELVEIECSCVDGDRGTLKPSGKWRIVERPAKPATNRAGAA